MYAIIVQISSLKSLINLENEDTASVLTLDAEVFGVVYSSKGQAPSTS
jgi:hypothetical protein